MKPSLIVPLAMVFATTAVFAQRLSSPHDVAALFASPLGGDCPIGLEVDHGDFFQKQEVTGDAAPGLRQNIHLSMKNLRPQKIVEVQFTVHGLSHKTRYLEVSKPLPDMAKTIGLALEIDGHGEGWRDLSLSRFAAVTAVDVDGVTYADGSTWRQPSPAACSVIPSALMRVGIAR